jgi:hypothetical protein
MFTIGEVVEPSLRPLLSYNLINVSYCVEKIVKFPTTNSLVNIVIIELMHCISAVECRYVYCGNAWPTLHETITVLYSLVDGNHIRNKQYVLV